MLLQSQKKANQTGGAPGGCPVHLNQSWLSFRNQDNRVIAVCLVREEVMESVWPSAGGVRRSDFHCEIIVWEKRVGVFTAFVKEV